MNDDWTGGVGMASRGGRWTLVRSSNSSGSRVKGGGGRAILGEKDVFADDVG